LIVVAELFRSTMQLSFRALSDYACPACTAAASRRMCTFGAALGVAHVTLMGVFGGLWLQLLVYPAHGEYATAVAGSIVAFAFLPGLGALAVLFCRPRKWAVWYCAWAGFCVLTPLALTLYFTVKNIGELERVRRWLEDSLAWMIVAAAGQLCLGIVSAGDVLTVALNKEDLCQACSRRQQVQVSSFSRSDASIA
jgi:hypothetical protein